MQAALHFTERGSGPLFRVVADNMVEVSNPHLSLTCRVGPRNLYPFRLSDVIRIRGQDRDGTAPLVESLNEKARSNTDANSSPHCDKGFFSQIPLSVPTLLRCPCSPWVQFHALTSVCTLKIPNTGSNTIVWTHENTAHIASRNDRVQSLLWLPFLTRVRQPEFPARDNKVLKKKKDNNKKRAASAK